MIALTALTACGNEPAPDPVKAELLTLCLRTEQTAAVDVTDSASLASALSQARPGQRIYLAPGRYAGPFDITASGTQAAPIVLCGNGEGELVGDSEGYVLHLDGAAWWSIQSLLVTGGQKGVVLDSTSHTSLVDLTVTDTGQEAVHLRTNSSDNVVIGARISDTGREDAKFGEGIYVGSAQSNWCRYTDCSPDRSDRNRILGNTFGSGVTAENIDVKEGTTGGVVAGNRLSGKGATEADAWVDIKGNGWEIRDNTGADVERDGMQVHVILPGWGDGNMFTGNSLTVDAPGYGFRIDRDATGTQVSCDNVAEGAGEGLSNIDCTPG